MTTPVRDANGWAQLPGGYVPNPVQPQPQPQQFQQPGPQPGALPQGGWGQPQPQVAPQPQPWFNPAPQGAPVEGTPPYYPQAPINPMLQQRFQQQPQPQPQPAPVQGQPQWQPQPGTDPNTRLTGPGIPQELQGRTFAEAMQIYNGMRNVVLQMVPGPGAPLVQQPATQPQAQPQPVAGQPQQPGWDWRNPEDGIRRAVRGEIQEQLAPVLHQTQQAAISAARNQAAAEIGPAFVQVESLIMQRLQGATPQSLASPQMWKTAAEAVIGQQVMQFARQQQTGQPQNGQPQTMQPMLQPQMPGQPAPNLNGFFTEQPNIGGPPGAQLQLSTQQEYVARAMGMDPATYAAWSGGGQRR